MNVLKKKDLIKVWMLSNSSERPKPEFSAGTRTGTEIISVRFRFGNSYRNRNGHFTTNIQLLIT